MAEDAIKSTLNGSSNKKQKDKKPKGENRAAKFFRDLRGEFKKIVWPSKKQVINNTIVVIAAVIVVGVFIWAIDLGLAALVKLFLGNA